MFSNIMAGVRPRRRAIGHSARSYLLNRRHRNDDETSGYCSDSGLERSDSLSSEDDTFSLSKSTPKINERRSLGSSSSSSDDGFESEAKTEIEESQHNSNNTEIDNEGQLVKKVDFENEPNGLFRVGTPRKWQWLRETEYFVHGSRRPSMADVSVPVHTLTDSLFSTSSGFNNYRGLLNLCIVLLVLSNARVAIENLIKYGVLVDPLMILGFVFSDPYHWPCIALLFASNVFIWVCLFIEKALASRIISERFGVVLHVINCVSTLVFPAAVILAVHPIPFWSSVTLGYYTSLFLKMISYASVNSWCREKAFQPRRRKTLSSSSPENHALRIDGDSKYDTPVQHYPENLNLPDLYYFVCCPTLCYELNFPRTGRIRKRFLIKRVVEMLFMIQIIFALIQQWMIPTINNSMEPFMNSNFSVIVTRIFKLAIPNHFIWLMFFYWFFHSCLNVVAELLRFGDREFYKDWWNAETVSGFWQTWNIPVHRWGKRHLYVPMLKCGFTKFQASVTVFLLSAFFHEYLVSIPLRMFKLWSFMGMAGQIPFAYVQARFLHGKYANMAVWLSLILGQPIAILMYVHDYYVIHAS